MKKRLLRPGFILYILGVGSVNFSLAQIEYIDVNPDVTTNACYINGNTCYTHYVLDLNNDGINDFDFSVQAEPGCAAFKNIYLKVWPANENSVGTTKLTYNDLIDSNSSWKWYTDLRSFETVCYGSCDGRPCSISKYFYGNWNDTTEGYLALKVMIDNQDHYGWLRLSVLSTFDFSMNIPYGFTIMDYAFNRSPGQMIHAGQTGTEGIISIPSVSQLSIFPNPFVHSTSIKFDLPRTGKAVLRIFDIDGRLIRTLIDDVFEEGEHQVTCGADGLNDAFYLLQIQASEYSKTEKLIILK
jgi:hypothetical protein